MFHKIYNDKIRREHIIGYTNNKCKPYEKSHNPVGL
jgi:hypothetical protein